MIPDLIGMNAKTLSEAAGCYLDNGLAIFPCRPGEKVPATGYGGFKKAVRLDGDMAIRLDGMRSGERGRARVAVPRWIEDGGYNLGIAAGITVDVLDVDVRHGKPGLKALKSIETAGLLERAVATARTPSGGYHVYFPASGERSRKIDDIGIEFKALGTYVLAAPSVFAEVVEVGGTATLISRRYEWTWSRCITEGAPISWAEVCSAVGMPERAMSRVPRPADPALSASDVVAAQAELLLTGSDAGSRNFDLFCAACRCAEAGATADEMRLLAEASLSLSSPDEDRENEVWTTINSAVRTAGSVE